MFRTYTAKTAHKRPCDLCGDEVKPGDQMVTWPWMNAEWGSPGDGFGNIMRVHAPCHEIEKREGMYEWRPGEAFTSDYADAESPLLNEARAAMDLMRSEGPA